ncbi:hypothetical protein XELAEV_18037740mg, partial [Xenopus laevis]
ADVWSLGITAIKMAEGYLPYSQLPIKKLIKEVIYGPPPALTRDGWSNNVYFFIDECLQKQPARRPSARQLLTHPFITNIWGEDGIRKNIIKHLQRSKEIALFFCSYNKSKFQNYYKKSESMSNSDHSFLSIKTLKSQKTTIGGRDRGINLGAHLSFCLPQTIILIIMWK